MTIRAFLRLFACAAVGMSCQTLAAPMFLELSTFGRLQSGPIVVAPLTVTLRYISDTDLVDAEPSSVSGSFESIGPVLLQIGSESASNHNAVGLFTNFDAVPQTYTVATAFSSNSAHFLGREFVNGVFNLIDFDLNMLVSDALPPDASFALDAERHNGNLTFLPIAGDPEFGTGGYTKFTICDSLVTNACVNAPITLRVVTEVPEPSALSLLFLASGLMLIVRPTRHLKLTRKSKPSGVPHDA